MKILLLLVLAARDPSSLCLEGESFYRAGEYRRATEIYESALTYPLSREQEEVVRYDLATAHLAAGDWERALNLYRQVDGERALIGRARAALMGSKSVADLSVCKTLMVNALNDWRAAVELEEGVTEELLTLKEALKEGAADISERIRKKQLAEMGEVGALAALEKGVDWSMGYLERFGSELVGPLAQWQRRLEPFWELLSEGDAVSVARNVHRRATERMAEGQVWPARDDLAEARHHLACLQWLAEEANPMEGVLSKREELYRRQLTSNVELQEALGREVALWTRTGQRLCESAGWERLGNRLAEGKNHHSAVVDQWVYRQMFEEKEVSIADLYTDVRDQQRGATWEARLEALELDELGGLEEALRMTSPRKWLEVKLEEWPSVEKSKRLADEERALQLMEGIFPEVKGAIVGSTVALQHALDTTSAPCEKVFEESANTWNRRAVRTLEGAPVSAIDLLKLVIEQQEEVKKHLELLEPETLSVVRGSERALLDEVTPFPELLSMERGEDKEAMDLFDKGVAAAESLFSMNEMEEMATAAGEAQRYWEEILKGDGGGGDSQEDEPSEPEPPEEEESASKQAMEWLQQMDREDEQRPPPRVPKQGLRPW